MEIKTRVPGVVSEILVKEGDHVDAKAVLAKIEAMKMFQSILTPVSGTVSEIMIEEDARVKAGAVLMVIDED